MFEREADVVGDKKIEMTVAVVIQKGTSGSPARRARLPQSGLLGHIREGAIAVVSEEAILTVIGAEDVIEAIVVVIGYAHAVGPAYGS